MPPWPPETIARWERRSRRVLLVAGFVLLAAHLLPVPWIDDDGLLRWMSPYGGGRRWMERFPFGPPPLVPQTLAFVALGAWYLVAARLLPLARRGAAVAWTSAGLVLAFASARVQGLSTADGIDGSRAWPWWDGSVAIPALGLLLLACPGRRRFARALCVLAGCVGLAPFLLAPAWDLGHLEMLAVMWDDELWARTFVVARALAVIASVALLVLGLAPARAQGRRLLATRLWLASLLAAFVAAGAGLAQFAHEEGAPPGTALCAWLSFALELGRHLAPLAGVVAGLFLVLATSRRHAEPQGPAA